MIFQSYNGVISCDCEYCMYELPLFPLNTVLFPGQPMSLHIFEERYKEMINLCVETHQPFGIVLLERGQAEQNPFFSEPAKPYMIGCTAQITQVKQLSQGRMNITVVGRERFKIHSLSNDKSYLVGNVEIFPMDIDETAETKRYQRALSLWLERYLQILEDSGQIQPGMRQLPNDASALAYLSAILLQGVESHVKQDLLAVDSLNEMLKRLCDIYKHEVVLLRAMMSIPDSDQQGPFSLN